MACAFSSTPKWCPEEKKEKKKTPSWSPSTRVRALAALRLTARFLLQAAIFVYTYILVPLARAALWLGKQLEWASNKGWANFLEFLREIDRYVMDPIVTGIGRGCRYAVGGVKDWVWSFVDQAVECMWGPFRPYWNFFVLGSDAYGDPMEPDVNRRALIKFLWVSIRDKFLSMIWARDSSSPAEIVTKRLTIMLDLDETLIHAVEIRWVTDAMLRAAKDNGIKYYQVDCWRKEYDIFGTCIAGSFMVFERPGVQDFLYKACQLGELHIFTEKSREYASPIIDRLDTYGIIRSRLYVDATTPTPLHAYVKDLSVVGCDLHRTILVDDNPWSFVNQPLNGVPCKKFRIWNGNKDTELLDTVLPSINMCTGLENVQYSLYSQHRMMDYFRSEGVNFRWLHT